MSQQPQPVARTQGRLIVAIVLLIIAIVCLAVFALMAGGIWKHHGGVEFGWLGAGLVLWAVSVLVRLWP